MNKITTKLRTLGRLSVWVSISFGIAIATSQTANAWQAINNIDYNVYFLTCSKSALLPEQTCPNANTYEFYDGEMALGHTLSCGQDLTKCGAGHGQDIFVAVPLVGAVRLLYPSVHVPPNGVVSFSQGIYIWARDENNPNAQPIAMQPPICQKWTQVSPSYPIMVYPFMWIEHDMSLCDQAPDRHRVP